MEYEKNHGYHFDKLCDLKYPKDCIIFNGSSWSMTHLVKTHESLFSFSCKIPRLLVLSIVIGSKTSINKNGKDVLSKD